MKRLALVTLVFIVGLAGPVRAVERVALPQFKSGYERPATDVPPPRADLFEHVDLAAFIIALSAASYLAIRVRSRRGLWILGALSLLYFGFWRGGCVCPIGSIQNVTAALFRSEYLPAAAIATFILPLVFTLFFGRTFCASVCPLGAMQDIVLVRPLKVPTYLEHALGLLAYVYLGAAVLFAATGATFIICEYDPFVSFFRLVPLLRPTDTMQALGGSTDMLIFGGVFLAVGLFIGRPYCRWFCPYGAILRLLSPFARRHVTVTPDECVQCRLCEDSCPFGAIRKPTRQEQRGPRLIDRRRLALLVVVVPVLAAATGWFGSWLGPSFARMHYTVRQADRVRLEQTGQVADTVDLSNAFYTTGEEPEALYGRAAAIENDFVRGGWFFGGWVGLVIGAKLIVLSVRRTRLDFEPDRGTCVSCGRCFAYCPVERQRLKKAASKAATT